MTGERRALRADLEGANRSTLRIRLTVSSPLFSLNIVDSRRRKWFKQGNRFLPRRFASLLVTSLSRLSAATGQSEGENPLATSDPSPNPNPNKNRQKRRTTGERFLALPVHSSAPSSLSSDCLRFSRSVNTLPSVFSSWFL